MKPEFDELFKLVDNSVDLVDGKVKIINPDSFRSRIDRWVEVSTRGSGVLQGLARFLVRVTAGELGIFPASIFDLYMARGRGAVPATFSVPALNLRVLSFDSARAAFQAAMPLDASAVIFEIARSEMGYTAQKPAEFATNVLAAAIAEGYQGPIFLQGDHYQVSAKKYAGDPHQELKTIQSLIKESIQAGFFNIDIDTSTMVDIQKTDLAEQQRLNVDLSVRFARFIRENQPEGVTISIGGEIGEVGGKNSTVEELTTYVDGFNNEMNKIDTRQPGLSKISIQTGTSHGGVVLPNGTIASVSVDFETLKKLSRVCRSRYGMGGTVQHGASTLPEEAFGKFVEYEAVEVHLATNFMNMFYDLAPADLKSSIYKYLEANFAGDRKPGMTDEQFYYKTRKNAIAPFKDEIFNLPADFHAAMTTAWREKFASLFSLLGLRGTRKVVAEVIKPTLVSPRLEDYLGSDYKKEDVSDLAD